MTKLIAKDDPLYFGQTSNEPYDRHHYKIVHKDHSFVVNLGMRFKSGGGIIVDYQHLMLLYTLLTYQDQKKVLNEFISRRKNHRFGIDYLCVFCYTTCISILWSDNSCCR